MKFEKIKGKKKFVEINKLIFGMPKTGKTTFAFHMKDGDREPYFLFTEEGVGELDIYGTLISDWENFKKAVKSLHKNKEEVRKKFSCIVLDIASEVDAMCTQHVCKELGIPSLADAGYGKGYDVQGREFQSVIAVLLTILPVTFICHSEDKEITTSNGETMNTQAPSFAKRAYKLVSGKCDAIGYIMPPKRQGDYSMLTFKPSMSAVCGSRFSKLRQINFPLVEDKMDASYKNIVDIFEGKKDVAEAKKKLKEHKEKGKKKNAK